LDTLTVGLVGTYSFEEAIGVLETYCFGHYTLKPKEISNAYGVEYDEIRFPKYAYETYDCVPASDGAQLLPVDLLVASGLNGQIDSAAYAGLATAAARAAEELARIDERVTFWDLPEDGIDGADGHPPPPEEHPDCFHLHAAWSAMMQIPHVDIALTHKVLHHKRPHLFPLLDNLTISQLEKGDAWRHIHRDLNRDAHVYERLERWHSDQVAASAKQRLKRLRIHDILLWWRASGKQEPDF